MPAKSDLIMRRERVKALFLSGMSQKEIAKELEVTEYVIWSDFRMIANTSILNRTAEVVQDAFCEYAVDIDWAVAEAKKMHGTEDNLDALRFIVDTKGKKLSTAQSMGLLEQAAKKIEVSDKRIIDPEKAKQFGDYLAGLDDTQG